MPEWQRVVTVLVMLLLVYPVAVPAAWGFPNGDMVNAEPVAACRAGLRPYETEDGLQLLGEIFREDFQRLLPGWDAEFHTYEPGAEDLAVIAAEEDEIEIICVLGTWCSDSKREVPRFWKILSEAGNPNLQLFMFGTGRTADATADTILVELGFDDGLRLPYEVELVPTFIFSRGGREIGRIIETPETTLEQDLARILSPVSGNAGKPGWK